MEREYDKLVRDNIPEIIEDNGEVPATRAVTGDEYESYLRDKLQEEVAEYLADRDADELADILEVVHALGHVEGLSPQELAERRERKANSRGGFEDGIVLERVN
ncbi:nucleoside triphosphate pyrophosphohydrolase [Natrialba sp. PRR66]|uniref:nucleoside triphosphate pyrophosphohydrolase n=1 Tax=Natrialba sp. PRR66 TaxID=3098146 RepID=UPI002B1DF977|nr:nucleoside triphosphate pyrophosphohydrolase [Natrialba sp. PRR66]